MGLYTAAERAERMSRAMCSLEGLSVGDAFGQRFFLFVLRDELMARITEHAAPAPPWHYTDDTQMALSIVDTLREHGRIDQDYLALSLAHGFDMARGYGAAMPRLLKRLREGEHWSRVAPSLFNGQGSFGNGSAMRVAPVGAYFADDLWMAAEQAGLSAQVTHAHPEALAGAVAVAVAAGVAWQYHNEGQTPPVPEFLDSILPYVPDSEVQRRMIRARSLPLSASVELAAAALGNGSEVSCQDTVPFALWCAARSLNSFAEALWLTVGAMGDIDTNCAIVGGTVVMHTGRENIPLEWLQSREELPGKPVGWIPEFQ